MGCANSKLDDLPVVALCRDRCAFLDEAIRQRYIISQAHIHYFHSLKTVGASLNRFFDHLEVASADQPPSPLLNLPPAHRKAHPPQPSSKLPAPSSPLPPKAHPHSHSNSGSHINFHSDDDDDDDDGDDPDHHHLHHFHDDSSSSSGPSPPLHDPYRPQPEAYPPPPDTQHSVDFDYQRLYLSSSASPYYHGGDLGGNFQHMNFMRKQSTTSVTYQQRPLSPEIVRMGGGVASTSSSSHYPPPPYGPQHGDQANPNFYPTYTNFSDIPGGSSGFLGSAAPYYASSSSAALPIGAYSSSASTSKEPPPPPSPPRASAWEFFNLFEGSDKYYPQYTPSRDWREVREEEGIPDLEEEDYQQEVVKEVHGNQKFVDGSRSGRRISGGGKATLEDEGDGEGEGEHSEALYRPRPSTGMESDAAEYEVHVVDKKVVDDDEERANVAGFKNRVGGRFKGGSEVVREIQIQFERASESGNELAKILEVGKLPHNRKHAAYQVPSKMLHAIAPSLSVVSSQPSTSKGADNENADSTSLDAEGELNLKPKNLSSTLQKLYLWEKKLYEEVKVEEKMRILHERKGRKLKRLDEKGAEAHKVDATRAMVESLSTKIRIAIQVVDKISVKISRLRDEELWPQLHELIQGLARMWKSMLECHHNQCQAILEAKHLDGIASHRHSSEAHIEVALQLEHEFINWAVGFSKWIGALKRYVRALNNWLTKCLLYVPEETPDGMAPFSPGRIGAPPVFVICNQWNQAFDRVSEKEVVDTMRDFAASVHPWEWDKVEVRQRMTANKETERKMKNLEREDQRLQKEMQTLDKVMVVGDGNGLSPTGQVVYQSDTSKSSSLQVGLQRIFEAMERFTANCLKVHEELLQRIEEVLAREPEKVS